MNNINIDVTADEVTINNHNAKMYRDDQGRWIWSIEDAAEENKIVSTVSYTAKKKLC